jgi:hypothetical protein
MSWFQFLSDFTFLLLKMVPFDFNFVLERWFQLGWSEMM